MKKKGELLFKKSPFRSKDEPVFDRDDPDVLSAIDSYSNAIEMNPLDVSNYFILGTIYYSADDFEKAEEYFEKAIEISPEYMEPYSSLALIAKDKKEYERALNQLKRGLKYLNGGRITKHTDLNLSEFKEIYIDFYNDMAEKTCNKSISLKDLKPVKKIGRNDPCPCKSGKKYKKCCLAK